MKKVGKSSSREWEADVAVRETTLTYSIFSDVGIDTKAIINEPLLKWKSKLQHWQNYNSGMATCTSLNRSRYVAVLTEISAESNRTAQYANTVWLPNEHMIIGACGITRRGERAPGYDSMARTFKFALYEVANLGSTTEEQRTRVNDIWQLDSGSCRPTLQTSDGAKLVCHLLLCPLVCAQVNMPVNKICVAERELNDPQILPPHDLWKTGTSDNKPKSFYFSILQASMIITDDVYEPDAKVVLDSDLVLSTYESNLLKNAT